MIPNSFKPSRKSKNAKMHSAKPNTRIVYLYKVPLKKDFDLPTNTANTTFDPIRNR